MKKEIKAKRAGKVYLVGAGPGDPKLMTLRGKELLSEADIIIYDYLANPSLLDFAKQDAEKIYVGKKGGARSLLHQERINHLLISAAKAGQMVVRLKGGDPFIFGRGGEEAEALKDALISFEVVPGVTSAIAGPTYAGIPLTHREMASSVAFVTGHEDPDKGESHLNWKSLVGIDTLVFLMGMGNLSAIVDQLMRHGRGPQTPIALIQWGTYPFQKTSVGRLNDIVKKSAADGIKPPVVMVVGEVVSLRDRLDWFESRPLFGKRILVTRSREQASEFAEILSGYGAETVSFPTIQIVPPPSYQEIDRAIEQIEIYDWIIFTSVNGVRFFKERLAALDKDVRSLKGISLCAIGPRTAAEVKQWGFQVDLIPDEFKAEGILKKLGKGRIAGKRFLIPRAKEAREILPEQIRKKGGIVDVVSAYQAVRPTRSAEEIEGLFQKGIDLITFASSSTLRNFIEMVGVEELRRLSVKSALACIGPITGKTAKEFGLKVDVQPKEYTLPALAEAIVDYFGKKR